MESRTELTIQAIRSAWHSSRGARFADGLRDFLDSRGNDNTLRGYAFSVLEFFERERERLGRYPEPDEVRRADAVGYAHYLANRTSWMTAEWLRRDPDPGRRLDLWILEIIGDAFSPPNVVDIRRELGRRHPELVTTSYVGGRVVRQLRIDADVATTGGLSKRLACLVTGRVLERQPTTEAARAESRVHDPDPDVYRYSLPVERAASGPVRSGTIATRLNALASLWRRYLVGDNAPGGEPLLRVNVWTEPLEQVSDRVAGNAAIARARKTPTEVLWLRLLATTFAARYPRQTIEAARAFAAGTLVDEPRVEKIPTGDLRDRAALMLLGHLGVRASELRGATRKSVGDINSDDGRLTVITVTGKRGKTRQLAVSPPVLLALRQLTTRLQYVAANGTAEASARARDNLRTDAPLIPSIKRAAPNARRTTDRGLTRQGLAMMLRRRAVDAGIAPDTEDFARCHPHGFRHMYAKNAADAGMPLHQLQATLGHSNVATTSLYIEERSPGRMVSPAVPMPVRATQEAPPVPPRPEPEHVPAPRREVAPEAPPATAPGGWLTRLYASDWGEAGHRHKLVPYAKAAARDIDPGAPEHPQGLTLAHTYVGDLSGLPWWLGPAGRLAPAMPVMSPVQRHTCDSDDAVCNELAALWSKYVGDTDARGPSAASALLEWLHQALLQARVTEEAAIRKGLEWVEPVADLEVTKSREALRQHTTKAVVKWFDEVAWAFRTKQGRVKRETTKRPGKKPLREEAKEGLAGREWTRVRELLTPASLPAWYRDADPVASLPADERDDLLDWLLVLTGEMPGSDRRTGRGTRREVGRFLQLLCQYEQARMSWQVGAGWHKGGADERTQEGKRRAAEEYERQIDDIARSSGVDNYNVAAERSLRAKGRWTAQKLPPGGRAGHIGMESMHRWMLDQVRAVYGDGAADDEIVGLAAHCFSEPRESVPPAKVVARPLPKKGRESAEQRAPLGQWKELFHVDASARTIVHTSEFIRHFAEDNSTHSECVARRMARELWELRRENKLRVGGRNDQEIRDIVASMRSFRAPCTPAEEREVRRFLPADAGAALYREWDTERRPEIPELEPLYETPAPAPIVEPVRPPVGVVRGRLPPRERAEAPRVPEPEPTPEPTQSRGLRLTRDQIMSVQRGLRHAGYAVEVTGEWDDATERAAMDWESEKDEAPAGATPRSEYTPNFGRKRQALGTSVPTPVHIMVCVMA